MTHAPGTPTVAVTNIDDAAAALRRHGGRLSASRRAVLEALFAADAPISAEDIAGSGALQPTSVYRTLESLEQIGIVRHIHLGHGPGLYALTGGDEREYLTCERCHRITAVDADALDGVRAAIERDFGYRARFTHFPIVGTCAACARD